MLDTETYADNATASLKDGLQDALDGINAEKGDFVLRAPALSSYSFGSSEVLAYPWIEVAVTNSDILNLDIDQQAGDQNTQVIVAIRYQDADGFRLDRALRRYSRAIVETLMQPDQFGYHDTVVEIRTAYGTNPEFDAKQMLTGVAVVGFAVAGTAMLPA